MRAPEASSSHTRVEVNTAVALSRVADVTTSRPIRRVRELLPTAAANGTPSARWDEMVDPRSRQGIETIYDVIVFEENTAQHLDEGALVRVARAFREDLLTLADDPEGSLREPDLRMLLLATTLCPAMVGVLRRRIGMAYDWLLWSVTEGWAVDGGVEMHPGWVVAAAMGSVPEALDAVVMPWLTALYTYGWMAAGLPVVCNSLLPWSMALVTGGSTPEHLDLACALLSWAGSRPDRSNADGFRIISDQLRSLADDDAAPASTRKTALRALASCSASVTGDDPKQRSLELLDRFGDELHATEHLEALGNALSGDGGQVAARIDEFLELIRAQRAEIESAESPDDSAWARGVMFAMIGPPLTALLQQGHVACFMRLVAAWQGLDSSTPLTENPLVGVLDRQDGLSWSCEYVPLRATPTGVDLPDFQMAANAFLSTTVTTRSGPATAMTLPERGRGLPSPEWAPEFQDAAQAFISTPDAQSARDAATGGPPTAMLVLPTLQAPVQALMLNALGWTCPLSMSLQASRPDARIERAVLWIGGSLFAAREREAVANVLATAAVEVTVRDEQEMTREQFLRDYHDAGFDLFWIGLHGIYDPLDPDAAHLLLPSEAKVPLRDLRYNPIPTVDRRLLVLNACDSGTTASLGGLGEIGLAASAAGPSQAVVCHLWPIRSETVAPVFAALLAKGLETSTYFQAYTQAVSTLTAGTERILHALPTSAAKLRTTVESHPEDFQTIAGWGSAAFFE